MQGESLFCPRSSQKSDSGTVRAYADFFSSAYALPVPCKENHFSVRVAPRKVIRALYGHMLILSSAYALPVPCKENRFSVRVAPRKAIRALYGHMLIISRSLIFVQGRFLRWRCWRGGNALPSRGVGYCLAGKAATLYRRCA